MTSPQKMKKVVSGALVVWLSGLVFLFCCGKIDAQSGEHCPLVKAGQHCDQAATTENTDNTDAPNLALEKVPAFDCCGFLSAVFDKVSRAGQTDQTALPVNKLKIAPTFQVVVKPDFQLTEDYRAPVFSRRKIFLKHRILLI